MISMRRLLATFLTACLLLTIPGEVWAKLRVGEPAPSFRAMTFDGQQISLADFAGQVLVINIWATWCTPCREELPLLEAYYLVQQKHGLRVLAITTEDSIPVRKLKPILANFSMTKGHRLRGGNYRELGGVPTNYVIDRAGVVRYAKAGAFDLKTLNELLVPLLREASPSSVTANAAH